MKTPSRFIRIAVSAIAILTAVPFARAATDTWTGGGGNSNILWTATANWNPSGIPQNGDDLVFTNNNSLINSNNIPSASFKSITFATPSGAFDLKGVQTTLTGGITNQQTFTPETIEFPIVLSGNVNVDVVNSGSLTLTNTISGSGSLSKSSGGLLTLKGSNAFTGTLTVNGGTVAIATDTNLSSAPASPAAGNIILNGGALETTATMGLNANRGIALGPTSGSGSGTLIVDSLTALTNSSIIANNGSGAGGLTKAGFGNLILFGANTYTGPTTNTIGSIILDFTKPTAPTGANGIINSASALAMGGGNAGPITTNMAQLIMAGTAAGNTQTFSSSFFTLGASVIGVTNLTASGVATLNLGAISHDPKAGLTFFSSPSTRAVITTTSGNTGGILGGWATIAGDADGPSLPSNQLITGTNWAAVDLSGHIVQFNNFYVVNAANHNTLHAAVDANTTLLETNILVGDASGVAVVATNDIDHAGGGDPGTTTDINSIKIWNAPTTGGSGVYIGRNNKLRLGVYGGILSVQTANTTPVIGGVSNLVNGGTANQAPFGSQDVGILTAGGPNNDTAGEIVITHSTTQGETTGGLIVSAQITDNGNGKVSVIKMGNGSIKLDGNNTYSGGLYMLQGRVQWQGTEIFGTGAQGGPGGTNGLNDGGGFGPIYILPGAYFAPSTSIPNITNDFFVAGAGDAAEKFGVFRGGNYGGNITMVGDATMCSDSANVFGPIHGPFNLTIGTPGQAGRNGNLTLGNSGNDWSGNTFMYARGSLNTLVSSNNEVIPNGFGKGNVIFQGAASAATNFFWNMNGFSETVNGFLTAAGGNASFIVVTNGFSQPLSTLTIGDNDQSGIFGGIILSNIAVTKIGAGLETFTNVNAYFGATTVSNGVLQLTGNGSIAASTNVSIYGGTFDVSAAAYTVPAAQTINVAGGAWFISSASVSTPVNITNGTLKVNSMSVGSPNLSAQTINLGSGPNLVQPVVMPLIDVYPKIFEIATYTTLNGNASTLAASLPAGGFPPFGGFVSNDAVNKQILLVMTNGPITPSLTWVGFSSGALNSTWDFLANDWTNKPAHTAASYTDGSLVTFDDTGRTNVVNFVTTNAVAGLTVTNMSNATIVANYAFIGSGYITGTNGVTKLGSGKLTVDNGSNDFTGGLSISAGTVQLGTGGTGGWLGNGAIGDNGTLVFNRNNAVLNIPQSISGSGGILLSNANSTTTILSGSSSISGDVYVKPTLTLDVANANALSSTNGTLTIPSSTTLDVSGLGIAANTVAIKKTVSVSGAGVDNTSGAIVNNTTTNQQNALLRVTLAANTTVGGSGRFDIRGTGAALNQSGGIYSLTKVGTGQFSIVGANVDPTLGDINVQGGVLSVETTTTGLGNTASNLNVADGAALQLFAATSQLNKNIVFGNSVLTNASGNNIIIGPMTLNGALAVGGNALSTLTLSNTISGTGSLTKNMTNTLVLTGSDAGPGGHNGTYSGPTVVADGTLIINGINSGSKLTENYDAASPVPTIVGGNGTNNAPTDIEDTLWPGVIGHPATFGAGDGTDYDLQGSLIFNDSSQGQPKAEFSLNTSTTVGSGVNDLVVVTGDLNGNTYPVRINPLTPLNPGSSYTIFTYTGTLVVPTFGSVAAVDVDQPTRYSFSLNTSTAHVVKVNVLTGAGNLVWNNNAANGLWDTNTSANWFNTGTSASDVFLQLDNVTFDDSIGGSQATVNLVSTNMVPGNVTVNNSAVNYTFQGPGSIGGAVGLVKQGTGTLIVSNANTFTGTVTVNNGTLAANAANALGSGALMVYGGTVQANAANLSLVSTLITNGTVLVNNTNGLGGVNAPIYVTNSGTLDFGGASFGANQAPLMGSKPIYISGWGVNSNGCLINSNTNGTAQENSAQNVVMTGDAAIGGPGLPNGGFGRFDLGRLTNGILSTGGNAFNLYKVGGSQVSFVALAVDPTLADIDIKGGELGLETTTSGLGNPNNTVTVEPGAILEFFSLATNLNKKVVINGGSAITNVPTLWFNSGSNNTIIGPVILTNGIVVIGGAGNGTLTNTVSGPGGMQVGCGLTLASIDTYTGNTIVSNNGTLFLTNAATINNSPNITILGGIVNVAGRANNTLTLASGQTLRGNGTINGTLTNLVGTILLTGTNGVLTVTTNASFGGSALIANQLDHGSNTVMAVTGIVTYGGTLTVTTNAASTTTLTAGTTYTLFKASSYNGSFSTINLPALDPSLTWDTSQLGNNGTIQVVSAGGSPFTQTPTVTSLSLNGSNVSISGTNGQAGDVYYLLQSTNVALPLSQWTVIATNVISSVGANGSFSFSGTNVIVPADQQQFYILSNTNSNH